MVPTFISYINICFTIVQYFSTIMKDIKCLGLIWVHKSVCNCKMMHVPKLLVITYQSSDDLSCLHAFASCTARLR